MNTKPSSCTNFYTSLLCFVVMLSAMAGDAPIVNTTFGRLYGKYMTSRNGRIFSAFLGIPYASCPVGDLRFLPPKSPKNWGGVRSAVKEGNICSQGKYGGSEDCLYANVFTHKSERLAPVMFYIHGGSFYMGSPSLGITGPEYFMDRDIVLVTIQYRLGPFGFLSTEDSVIPGNMGLKDQVKALQWVQDNMKYFGGNPKNVTIFGCSAGSSSVHLHMQSAASQNLFSRGISQSGTALSFFALMGKGSARKYTLQLANVLNCPTENSHEILKCLQQRTTAEIEEAHQKLQNCRYSKSIFRPVIEEHSDHAFLTSSPLVKTTNKPWMTGITANEGILNIRTKHLNDTINRITSDFRKYGPQSLLFDDICSRPNEIADLIYNFYFKNTSTTSDMINSIEKLFTDSWFLWPMEEAIVKHQGPLYCYLYNHQGEHSYAEVYDSPQGVGVSHLDDLLMLFKHSQYFPILNEQDTNISKLMVDFWVNFATVGDPTPLPISNNPQTKNFADFTWKASNNMNRTYIHIKSQKLSMQHGIYPDRLEFWRKLDLVDELP